MHETSKRQTKRRGNGEGSIFQRADGRWCARVAVGVDGAGKRIRRDVYAWSKTEVQEKLAELMQQKRQGSLTGIQKQTVAEYITGWLEQTVRPNYRFGTYAHYEYQMRKLVLPFIGGLKLAKLKPDNLKALYNSIRGLGKSASRVQIIHTMLRKALKLAVLEGKLSRNPCDLIERPKAQQREMTAFSGDHARAFILACEGHRLNALFVLAISTGLREGELFGLRWDDVDFETGRIQVRRTVNLVRNQFIVSEPKTAKGKRSVVLPGFALESLQAHLRQTMIEGLAGAGLVFPSLRGGYLRRDVLCKAFGRILANANLPKIRFHDLRHTHATQMMEAGVSPKVMQERLGHAKIATTLGIYSHVLPSMQQDVADKTERLFRGVS